MSESRFRLFWRFIALHISERPTFNFLVLFSEFVLTVVVICIDPEHMSHFTWWGLAAYGLYAGATLFLSQSVAHFFWGVSITLSTIIFFGVCGLSIARCSLLQDTLDDLGGSGYFLGNFAVHYWPLLRLYFTRPSDLSPRFWNQALYGLSFLLVYLSVMEASEVYGCTLPENTVVRSAPALVVVPFIVRYVVYPA